MTFKINFNQTIVHVFLFILILASGKVLAQQGKPVEVSNEITEAILKDVWQPFMESYKDLDIEKFKSIHANNLTRVSIDMNKIETGATYLNNIDGFFQRVKKMNRQVAITFSILSSATSDTKTYQTGYYCFSSRGSDSENFQPRGYAFFNVILIRENEVWKISMDADKKVEIDEDEFRKSGVIYKLE